jgi:radical SAM superfamily enzyme YgiQ (UPF0313 family)
MPKYSYRNFTAKPNYQYRFPTGLAYISAVLKQNKFDYDCINLNHESGLTVDILKRKLDAKKYDIVGLGGMAMDYQEIEKIINACKVHESKPKIILGGAIVTSNKELVSKSLNFDIGIIGEGEVTIIELLKKLEKGESLEKVNGICYKEEGKVIFTPPRDQIEDLDALPFPDYESFGFKKFLDHMDTFDLSYGLIDYPRTYQVLGSRGCAFQCTFCHHSIGSKYRKRSIKNIIEEIEFAIKEYDIHSINLNDDLFSADKERLYEFCREIKRLNKKYSMNLYWWCALWVGVVDEKMLNTLMDAGCLFVTFGFESYSKTVLKSMKKPITPEQIDATIKLCMKTKMPITGLFIFGDLAETNETAKETLDYWKANCNGQVKLFFIHPYPGSEIYKSCLERGIIKDELNFVKNEINHTHIRNMTLNMSDEDFEKLKKEVYNLTMKDITYNIPSKVKKVGDTYEITTKCPHCQEEVTLKNCWIGSKRFFTAYIACRNCKMKYYISSKLYKFTMDHYVQLDFFRQNYLKLRDRFIKTRL